LRGCPLASDLLMCETLDHAAAYWRIHIETHPKFIAFAWIFLLANKHPAVISVGF